MKNKSLHRLVKGFFALPNLRKVALLCLFAAFGAFPGSLKAQSEADIIKQADKYFEIPDYAAAMPLYSQLLANHRDNPNYSYRFGVCMLYASPDKDKALPYLEDASKSPKVDPEVWFYLGVAYHLNYRFDDALVAYAKFKKLAGDKKAEKYQLDNQMAMCRTGRKLLKAITDITVLDKKELNRDDFFHAYDLQGYSGQLLAKGDEFKTALDKKKNETSIIFLSGEKNVLYFASYGNDESQGKDIYKVNRLPNGDWGKPQNVGYPINTEYDEDYPFLHPNGKVLYFCSKGHNSMGGYDIFRSELNEETNTWEKPVNMDFAINSPDDDIMFVTDYDEKTAWFASSRNSPSGKITVYHVSLDRKPVNQCFITGVYKPTNNDPNRTAKITVKNADSNEPIGIYKSNDKTGSYFMSLPNNGGKYTFTVDHSGIPTQTQTVLIPPQYQIKPINQQIFYKDENNDSKLFIVTNFDDDSASLSPDFLKDKAKLDVNGNPDALASSDDDSTSDDSQNVASNTQHQEDSSLTQGHHVQQNQQHQQAVTNADLVKAAQDDADATQKDATDAQNQANAAYAYAADLNKQARAKGDEAAQARSAADALPDGPAKNDANKKADDLQAQANALQSQTVAAFTVAQALDQDATAKQKEADASKQYSSAVAKAVHSNDPKAIDQLDVLQQQLQSSTVDSSQGLQTARNLQDAARQKNDDLQKAQSDDNDLKDEIRQNYVRIQQLKDQMAKEKDKDIKQGIQSQIDGINDDIADDSVQLKKLDARVLRLQNDANDLANQAAAANSTIAQSKNTSNSPALTADDKKSIGSDVLAYQQHVDEAGGVRQFAPVAGAQGNIAQQNTQHVTDSHSQDAQHTADTQTQQTQSQQTADSHSQDAQHTADVQTQQTQQTADSHSQDAQHTADVQTQQTQQTADSHSQDAQHTADVQTQQTQQTQQTADTHSQDAQHTADTQTQQTQQTADSHSQDAQHAADTQTQQTQTQQTADSHSQDAQHTADTQAQQTQQTADSHSQDAQHTADVQTQQTQAQQTADSHSQDAQHTADTQTQQTTDTQSQDVQQAATAKYTSDLSNADTISNPAARDRNRAQVYNAWAADIDQQVKDAKTALAHTKSKPQKDSLNQVIKQLQADATDKHNQAKASAALAAKDEKDAAQGTTQSSVAQQTDFSRQLSLADQKSNPASRDSAKAQVYNDWADSLDHQADVQAQSLKKIHNAHQRDIAQQKVDSLHDAATQKRSQGDQALSDAATASAQQQSTAQTSSTLPPASTDVQYSDPKATTALQQHDADVAAAGVLRDKQDSLLKAASAVQGDQRTKLLTAASDAQRQAWQKDADASTQQGAANKVQFDTNENLLKGYETASSSTNDPAVMAAQLMNDDAKTLFKKAQDDRDSAAQTTDPYKKDQFQHDADEREASALKKQQDAIARYKQNGIQPQLVQDTQQTADSHSQDAQHTADTQTQQTQAQQTADSHSQDAQHTADTQTQQTQAQQTADSHSQDAQHTADTQTQQTQAQQTADTHSQDAQHSADTQTQQTQSQQTADTHSQDAQHTADTQTQQTADSHSQDAQQLAQHTQHADDSHAQNSSDNNSGDAQGNSANTSAGTTFRINAASIPVSIPVNPSLPEGLVYKVQVGAFRNPIQPSVFKGIQPLMAETTSMGFTRYTAGSFKKLGDANSAKVQVQQLGFKDAFVVAFYNGKRISLGEAQRMSGDTTGQFVQNSDNNQQNAQKVQHSDDTHLQSGNQVQLGNVKSTDVKTTSGLFFTVQVGVYSQKVNSAVLNSLPDLVSDVLPNGLVRYSSGKYCSETDAAAAKNIVVGRGINDAFVTAYSDGKRITPVQANTLIAGGANPCSGIQSTKIQQGNAGNNSGSQQSSSGNSSQQNSSGSTSSSSQSAGNTTQQSSGSQSQSRQQTQQVAQSAQQSATQQDDAAQNNSSSNSSDVNPPKNTSYKPPVSDTGLVFSVQLGAFRDEVPIDIANKFLLFSSRGIKNYVDPSSGFTVYQVGIFRSHNDADALRNDAVSKGLPDAFIVAWFNGKKIPMDEALKKAGQ